jgi:hypothetical protein
MEKLRGFDLFKIVVFRGQPKNRNKMEIGLFFVQLFAEINYMQRFVNQEKWTKT